MQVTYIFFWKLNKEKMCQYVIGIAEKSLNIVIIYDNIIDVLRMLQFVSTRHENLLNAGDIDEEVT